MNTIPACPQCSMEHTYLDMDHYVCPDCAHEWSPNDTTEVVIQARDAHGTPLADGDSVTVIKDLKVRGSSMVIKQGTMIKNIRIVEGDHDIDCRINGTSMQLKSEFMKKA